MVRFNTMEIAKIWIAIIRCLPFPYSKRCPGRLGPGHKLLGPGLCGTHRWGKQPANGFENHLPGIATLGPYILKA